MRSRVTYAVAICSFLSTSALHAQTQYFDNPFIYGRGIVNAASYMPAGLAGGSIAQGSIFTIFGTLLGPATGVKASSFPLGTALAGVSLKVLQGNTSIDAIPIYVSASQINAIMPSNAPLGRASVQVTYKTTNPFVRPTSSNAPVNIVPSSVGILTVNSAGFGPGIFTDGSYNYVTLAAPAKPGQAVILWGTGLGPITAADNQPAPQGNLSIQTEVFVGGQAAALLYSGRAPSCCSGLDQIVFTVPDKAPTGCWVPVQVRTGGTVVSNTATLAISANGSPCSDPFNPLAQPSASGQAAGIVSLHRVDLLLDQLVISPSEPVADFAYARILRGDSSPFFFNSLTSLPPPGSCTTYGFAGDVTNGAVLPGANGGGLLLDAGSPLTVSGLAVPRLGPPLYDQLLGSNDSSFSSHGLIFEPGTTSVVSAPGGADVGPFQTAVPAKAELTWTNRTALNRIDRTQPLTVTWDPASASGSTVILVGGNVDTPHNASSVFLCSAAAADGSLTVPVPVLANVPPTGNTEIQPKGMLFLGAVPIQQATSFSATGLGAGAAFFSSALGKSVAWH